ncbi:hypothetical protein Tco_0179550 [Tanacetum coccineum]
MNHLSMLFTHMEVLRDDLKKTKLTYSAAVTKLILRVKKLEAKVKAGTARKRARVVLSEDDEDVEDDSSKQGRKLSDAEVQEKASTETEPIIQEVTPTEVIQDQGSSEKGNSEVSTAGATKGTASEVPVISTAEENISTAGRTVTYRRRSEEKRSRKDKGKAIMTEPEPKKKSKKELEQERDEEIARQWNEEEGQRAMSEAKSSKKIDWNDPSVIRYHALKIKPKTVAQARRNMVKYLKNQGNYKISDFKGIAMSSRLLAFTSFFLHVFSSIVEGTVIFVAVDVPVSDGVVTGIVLTLDEDLFPTVVFCVGETAKWSGKEIGECMWYHGEGDWQSHIGLANPSRHHTVRS